MYYNRQGEPIDRMTWGRLFEDLDYKVIAQHWVRGWMISTIWMGIDHGFGLTSRPLLFETMIFPPGDETEEGEGIFSGMYQERYFTEDEAGGGHNRALALICEKLGTDSVDDILTASQFCDQPPVPDDLWEREMNGIKTCSASQAKRLIMDQPTVRKILRQVYEFPDERIEEGIAMALRNGSSTFAFFGVDQVTVQHGHDLNSFPSDDEDWSIR
jgi:hypothetical protein